LIDTINAGFKEIEQEKTTLDKKQEELDLLLDSLNLDPKR